MNYKILGDYIRKVDNKNKDLKVLNLQGLSMTKEFRKSTSNIVGTDLSKYKIVKQRQFCCDFMSVIRVHKLPVVLNNLSEDVIISPAYIVFEVIDTSVLLPEYLMLWFRRTEFDRYADFRCDSSIRGGFQWEELCEVELPIPSIEKQREIVAQYEAVTNKIKVNEAICEKLEATAQALYKQWFVDFEFPNDEGQPYKSSGGDMVFNEELEKEIPEGWEVKSFTEIIKLTGGGTPSTDIQQYWNGKIPFFTPADISKSYYSIDTLKYITELGLKESSTKLYPKNTIFITARGTVGAIGMASKDMAMNQSCYAIKDNLPFFTHQKTLDVIEKLKGEAVGAVFSALVTKDFEQQIIIEPTDILKDTFNRVIKGSYDLLLNKSLENQKLTQLQSLLLSRLATLEE
ncbi:restriction endonuclease subunit S [Myroides odoratimimus]|uniref:restriction endonuclease subunit S n=2 Tax=Myroides odoratimimus TaxID=76832 RepID=UPI0025785A84|nr:restriction endonuclease subunit S [Myroides odoratimimus]MDM1537660.1 restriction endonuclease subunit S [Myroides odoratimimus]MDM1677201.1 restriction endonuclease subunit S [Myroides odoratimimus]